MIFNYGTTKCTVLILYPSDFNAKKIRNKFTTSGNIYGHILSHYLKDSFIENATRQKCGYEALKGQMEPPFILPLS